jgi:uncharacterized integral membrane protein
MGRIIFSIVSLIAFAVIVVMNIGTNSSFNLFGWEFADVPVIVIAILSFVAGALYSFVYYLAGYFARSRKQKLAMQKEQLKSQQQTMKTKDASLKEREKQMRSVESHGASAQPRLPSGDQSAIGSEPIAARSVGSGGGDRPGSKGGWLRNLFGKKTNSGK